MAIVVHKCALGKIYSGSFTKLYALGSITHGTGLGSPLNSSSVLDNISFGQATDPLIESKITSTITDDLAIPAGTYLEGPIAYFKIKVGSGVSGSFLAYYDDNIPFSTDE